MLSSVVIRLRVRRTHTISPPSVITEIVEALIDSDRMRGASLYFDGQSSRLHSFDGDREGHTSALIPQHYDGPAPHIKSCLTTVFYNIAIIMSENISTRYDSQTEQNRSPLLSRGLAIRKPQSGISRLYCKLTGQPDDIATEKELTEWSRQGVNVVAGRLVSRS